VGVEAVSYKGFRYPVEIIAAEGVLRGVPKPESCRCLR
jgi:hypothetical protein